MRFNSPGGDLTPRQPPMYGSLVKSSSRSRKAQHFFPPPPPNLRPALQTEEPKRFVLLSTREAEAKVEHWSGDMKLGLKKADTRLPRKCHRNSRVLSFSPCFRGRASGHTLPSATRCIQWISLLMQVTHGFKHHAGVLMKDHPTQGFPSLTVLPERPTGRILGFVA